MGKYERPEDDKEETTINTMLWEEMQKTSLMNLDQFDNNFFEVLEMDEKEQFPFILFVLVSRTDDVLDQANMTSIAQTINNNIKNFVHNKSKKYGYKVLIIIVPVDNQTQWKDHVLSNILAIPNALPNFVLVCKQKGCSKCKSQKSMNIINIFSGIQQPYRTWLQTFLYGNNLGKNVQKAPLPYTNNEVGIIPAILAHNFDNPSKRNSI